MNEQRKFKGREIFFKARILSKLILGRLWEVQFNCIYVVILKFETKIFLCFKKIMKMIL